MYKYNNKLLIFDGKPIKKIIPSIIAVTGVNIIQTSIDFVETGQTQQLAYTVSPFNATNKAVTWQSSDTDVATVSSTGLVTSVDGGTATITITTVDGGLTDTCDVKVINNPVWSGLTSYYRLDEGSGTVVNDAVSTNDLTNVNGVIVNGKKNYGINIGASGAYIHGTPSMFNFERTDAFSFSMWVKRNSIGSTQGLVTNQNRSAPYRGYALTFISDNRLYANLCSNHLNNQTLVITTNTYTSTTEWYHIVWTYDGSSTAIGNKVYVNGVNQNYTIEVDYLTQTIQETIANFRLGVYELTSNGVNGIMDEVGIWNRALSPTEVQALYNNGNGLFY